MKRILLLLSLCALSFSAFGQDLSYDDQYPETDPATFEGEEYSPSTALPMSDYEEVPREEQEYAPASEFESELPPEEYYEDDEVYVE